MNVEDGEGRLRSRRAAMDYSIVTKMPGEMQTTKFYRTYIGTHDIAHVPSVDAVSAEHISQTLIKRAFNTRFRVFPEYAQLGVCVLYISTYPLKAQLHSHLLFGQPPTPPTLRVLGINGQYLLFHFFRSLQRSKITFLRKLQFVADCPHPDLSSASWPNTSPPQLSRPLLTGGHIPVRQYMFIPNSTQGIHGIVLTV